MAAKRELETQVEKKRTLSVCSSSASLFQSTGYSNVSASVSSQPILSMSKDIVIDQNANVDCGPALAKMGIHIKAHSPTESSANAATIAAGSGTPNTATVAVDETESSSKNIDDSSLTRLGLLSQNLSSNNA